jgi:diacylglycerol O-acyltransferase / wax synthase
MTQYRQLTPQDVMFVGGETPNVYQHTLGLILLDASGRPGFGYEEYRRQMERRLAQVPHFRWKLHEVPLGLDLPYWVEDENFSFDHHVRRIAVPSPGDRQAVGELVSYLYTRHLDRSRPLWETWFIEGLEDGQYAVVQKMHHCMMDGEGAIKLMDVMCDLDPDAPPRAVDPAIAEARPGQVPQMWQQSLNAGMRLSRLPMAAGREISGALWREVSRRLGGGGKRAEKPKAPRASFNRDIGSGRGFVYGSLPLADIKAIKSHYGVTVNDVLLAVVGSSLRDYLEALGELPEQSLRTSLPVSLRTETDDGFSNKVTTKEVTLATAIADPVGRLQAIARETEAAKLEAHSGHNRGVMEIVQIMPPVLINALLRMTPGDKVAEMMGINVVVSNVRGGSETTYIAGARMTAVYPMSIIAPGGGINFTCVSDADYIHCGCTIEPELVPRPWLIIDRLHAALADLISRVGGRATRSKKIAVKPVATGKKRPAAKGKAKPKAKSRARAG